MKRIRRWLPSLVWMVVIFYLSAQTGDEVGGWVHIVQRWIPSMEGFDWGHFVSYFILALTYAWGFGGSRLTWGTKIAVIVMCGLFGVTDEFHQLFVPGRTSDVMDLRNDMIGAALAMLLITIPAVRSRFEKWTGANYY